ncbi:MAG: GHKL domain-containing protein [Lachnospiraceae bacterium]|nr:GHKL domain-containing protein [Lachnospiraceae bacterium]
MKKKLNFQLTSIAILSILLTMTLILIVYYDLFRQQVMEELKTVARMLSNVENLSEYSVRDYDTEVDNMRITLLDKEGNVIYDTDADASFLDNHAGRPEIAAAYEHGEGEAIRMSDTLSENTFYYAICLNDGGILRVAKEARSIFSVLGSMVPSLIVITFTLTILCAVIARFLTKSLIQPIEDMANDIEHMGEVKTYTELEPFINTINSQHEDIIKSAKLRQEFTANVSHELKTPLTAISGYAELIANGMANGEDTVRFAGEIHRNSTRLLTLINDILRLSELDSQTSERPLEDLDLYEAASTCISMLELSATKHNVTFHLYGQRTFIQGDPQMLEEILYNLCDNAIRYNVDGGKVDISIKENEEHVILMVQDTGIGISEKDQQRIFERFYRVDKSRSKKTGGTGLGLAIVKHIAEQMNAKLQLDSTLGKGTTITIFFPQK